MGSQPHSKFERNQLSRFWDTYRVSQKKVDSNKYLLIFFVARAIFFKVCMLVADIMALKKIRTATIFDV